jgi:HNH endonuclease
MKIKSLPELNYLNECFVLDSNLDCGLRWNINRPAHHFSTLNVCLSWNQRFAGKPAGSILGSGYYYSRILNDRYPNHRIIYAIHNKTIDFDDMLVDHIDNNKMNNTPANLRLATYSENQHNSNKQVNNTSGHKNISFVKKLNKYRCAMRYHGKDIYIGLFETLEEALVARDSTFKQLTGDFYRV